MPWLNYIHRPRPVYSPRIPVETHNYTLYSTTILGARAFCEDFINLLLSSIETEVTDLQANV